MEEKWKVIKGYEGHYWASSWGRIKSKQDIILRPWKSNKCGHLKVGLSKKGVVKRYWLHRLIAKTFLGEPSSRHTETRHLDGNPNNNHAHNLMWGTTLENVQDAKQHGTTICWRLGEKNPRAKLTNDQVIKIKQLLKNNQTHAAIAQQFNVDASTITRINTNKIWNHIN